jgi:cyclophilin family peptidyl-prolyl cis-trans isomerase
MSSDPDFSSDSTIDHAPGSANTPRRAAIRTALATGAIIAAAALTSQVLGSNNDTIAVGAPSDAVGVSEVAGGSAAPVVESTATLEVPTVAPLTSAAPSGEVVVTAPQNESSTSAPATTSSIPQTTTTAATATPATKAAETTSTTQTPSTTSAPSISTTASASAETTSTISLSPGQLPCPPIEGAATRTATFTIAPPLCINPKATYRASIKTSEGVLTVALDAKKYPNTVNNFVYLSRYRFYDGLTFHRVVPKFIIQGGDPLANGRGSAGYEFADELPGKPTYNLGALAMANGRPTQPNTNGSQFFIVVGELAKTMTPDFPQFGNVVDGKAVLRKISALGPDPAVDATGTPSKPVTIESITITARGEKSS